MSHQNPQIQISQNQYIRLGSQNCNQVANVSALYLQNKEKWLQSNQQLDFHAGMTKTDIQMYQQMYEENGNANC